MTIYRSSSAHYATLNSLSHKYKLWHKLSLVNKTIIFVNKQEEKFNNVYIEVPHKTFRNEIADKTSLRMFEKTTLFHTQLVLVLALLNANDEYLRSEKFKISL